MAPGSRATAPTSASGAIASRASARFTRADARRSTRGISVVAPGFIDGHTHMDAQVAWDPLGTCSCWHGVTSVVMGNCGFTLAPCRPDEKHLVVRNLERAEDIPAEAMQAGIEWTWETYAQYLEAVARWPKGINYAGYVGHSALRTYAMGERAFSEPATAEDLAVMKRELARRAGRGGDGVHDLAHAQPRDGRPAAGGQPRRRVGRGARAGAGDGRPRRRHLRDRRRGHGPRSRPPARLPRAAARPRGGDRACRSRGACSARASAPDVWRAYFAMLDETARAGGRMFAQVHSRALARRAVVRDQAALRSAARVARGAAAPARRAARAPARRRAAPAAGEGGRRGGVRPRRRRRGPEARLRLDDAHGGSVRAAPVDRRDRARAGRRSGGGPDPGRAGARSEGASSSSRCSTRTSTTCSR